MTSIPVKKCLNCANSFQKRVNESRVRWLNHHKYCSRRCSAIHRKIGQATRFSKGHPFGKRFRKGVHPSPKTEFKKGVIVWNKGLKGYMAGPANNRWRGGVTPVHERIRRITEYKQWRKAVFLRDDWTCQFCGDRCKQGHTVFLAADHIVPFMVIMDQLREEQGADNIFEKARNYAPLWDIGNGRTLCRSCHVKTPTYSKGSYNSLTQNMKKIVKPKAAKATKLAKAAKVGYKLGKKR